MAERQIVRIDEELCNGCGACVVPCAEGAIEIIEGKARVNDEALCDGAGFCIPICPTGAMSVETREAPDFDEGRAHEVMQSAPAAYIAQRCFQCSAAESEVPLVPVRHKGESLWTCTRCLPALIHG
jgi:MinD superfamily P-loop ATPase